MTAAPICRRWPPACNWNSTICSRSRETLQLLQFAEVEEGDIRLTQAGRDYALADVDARKLQFADALRQNVPLIAAIRQVLDERWNHRASAVRFLDELEDHMSPSYADSTLKAAISWGRFAELFSYDDEADQFFLDEDDQEADEGAAAE